MHRDTLLARSARALLSTLLLLGCETATSVVDVDASPTHPLSGHDASVAPGDGGSAPEQDAGTDQEDAGATPAPEHDAGAPAVRDAGAAMVRDAGTPAPPPVDPGPGSSDRPYDLGAWPDPAMAVAWPAAPTITRDVRATTIDAASAAAAVSGTRVIVSGSLAGTLSITASDVEVVFEPGASAGAVWIANRIARVAVHGGRVDHVEMELPATFWPTESWHRDWMTTDVLIDGIEADAADTAFLMRSGIRIAITNSRAHAVRYGVWFGDTADFQAEDVIVAGNHITCDGPEATVRLVNVLRSATIGNRLQNGLKHNYRVHGRSDLNWAARNTLVETGVMIGTMEGDVIGREWFDDNVFYHRAPSLFQVDPPRVSRLVARGNEIHTDVWDCFLCVAPGTSWVLTDNLVGPYVEAPAE